jgi:Protein of unknown function (DUF2934)
LTDKAQQIRELAYRLWEAQGRPEDKDAEHWREAEQALSEKPDAGDVNEGEGSQSGAREYNRSTVEFIETGWVEAAAQEAADALDDKVEAAELQKAEEAGKARSRGEDPLLKK